MIKALIYLVIILIGLIISPYLSGLNGYLYVAIGDQELETSLIFALFAAILFYALLVCVEAFVVWTINLILNSRLLPEKWRRKKARKHTLYGALALAEEDWAEAEIAMAKGANKGEIPALNLLAAARAAQHQNNTAARDEYLLQAEKDPQASAAVQTTRLRYLLQQGELEQARAILDQLNPTSKSKRPLLRLAIELYQAQEDWNALKLLLPIANKRNILTQDEFNDLNDKTNRALLNSAADKNEQELEKAWHWLSRSERKQSAFIAQYAIGIAKFDRKDEAVKMLFKALKNTPNQDIFKAIATILSPADLDARKHIFDLEKKYADDANYQACIASLYDQSKEYRESQKWWQKVCHQTPSKNAWLALAEAQEHLGEQNAALQSYRKAAIF
ncbi:heme biosynthesis HemY N-terminal domain-containing protein [Shewanella psychrotolerans]|uniref:heme biosynthesis HemY N-terminal domain-containing protein n=1 Tax=Shewanella psychrotolerans TaxID=2864206 RepID=UPI001C65F6C8|nr:heme biosynthesis HemY N-terminal domain-containing protein [Shewanella psychrotolerans]QYK01162.1 heme biosynthesis protein HemY [Shewanella psychrotolerans]